MRLEIRATHFCGVRSPTYSFVVLVQAASRKPKPKNQRKHQPLLYAAITRKAAQAFLTHRRKGDLSIRFPRSGSGLRSASSTGKWPYKWERCSILPVRICMYVMQFLVKRSFSCLLLISLFQQLAALTLTMGTYRYISEDRSVLLSGSLHNLISGSNSNFFCLLL